MIGLRKNTPTLRFPEFTHEWRIESLDQIFALASGTTPSRAKIQYFQNGTHNWVKTTDLNNAEIAETEERVTDLALEETSLKKYPRGTVLIALYGGFNQIGRTGLLKVEAAINQALVALPPNSDRVEPYFLLCFLNRNVLSWRRVAASSRKDPNLTQNDVAKFHFAFPHIQEQRKIGAFLSTVDEKIRQLSNKKKLLLKYKKGLMQQIFKQKIRFNDNGVFFSDWEDVLFHDIVELRNEKFDSAAGDSRECLELEHLDQGTGKLLGTADSKTQKSIKNVFFSGDILFGKLRPYLRKYWYATFDGVCSSEIWVFKPRQAYQSRFVFYLVQSATFFQAVNISSGSKMPRAEWDVVSKYYFSVPTDEKEQLKIADFLSRVDEKIDLIRQQLEKTETFKKGLLQKMFV